MKIKSLVERAFFSGLGKLTSGSALKLAPAPVDEFQIFMALLEQYDKIPYDVRGRLGFVLTRRLRDSLWKTLGCGNPNQAI